MIVQSTATDADFALLTSLAGSQIGQSVNYSSTSDASSWAGSLSGTYLGTGLSLACTGNLSDYPSTGAVTWSDTGSYGMETWAGTGSATIANTSATGFQLTFSDSIALGGSSTASISSVIDGLVTPNGTILFGDSTHPEAGPGTATVNGTQKDIYFSCREESGALIFSDVVLVPKGEPLPPRPPTEINNYVRGPLSSSGPSGLNGTIAVVPEPSLYWPGLVLFLGTLCMSARRRKAGSGRSF